MKKIITILIVLLMFTITSAEFKECESCHADIVDNMTTSLHYTGDGMMAEYIDGAASHFDIKMEQFYEDKKCYACHVTACSDCHGLLPHADDISGNIETCDKCHKKKQATFVGDMPAHKSQAPSADIHYEMGLVCTDCHKTAVHGDGTEYVNMLTSVKVKCIDCHTDSDKEINGISVTQYSKDIESHDIHDETVDCTACHVAYMVTCVDCHLDTMKTESITTDKFYLFRDIEGKVKPFLQMQATLDGETHTAYAEYFTHSITNEPHNCSFCHDNLDRFTPKPGQFLGPEGASRLSQETLDRIKPPSFLEKLNRWLFN